MLILYACCGSGRLSSINVADPDVYIWYRYRTYVVDLDVHSLNVADRYAYPLHFCERYDYSLIDADPGVNPLNDADPDVNSLNFADPYGFPINNARPDINPLNFADPAAYPRKCCGSGRLSSKLYGSWRSFSK